MKYLTKKWAELSGLTDLYFDKAVLEGTDVLNEALYHHLYKIKETEFIAQVQEQYDLDPRFLLEDDGMEMLPLHQFIEGLDISETDVFIYKMSDAERENIQSLIEAYDHRLPFDIEASKDMFKKIHLSDVESIQGLMPQVVLDEIADVRVFVLGYTTERILKKLKKIAKEAHKAIEATLKAYHKAMDKENIPTSLKDNFGFHDYQVKKVIQEDHNFILYLECDAHNPRYIVTFVNAEVIKQETHLVGTFWVHQELYKKDKGYEVHLLMGEASYFDFVLRVDDIVIQEFEV